MKLNNIKDLLKNKNKEEMFPTILLGVAVLCGILILLKVTGFFMASARAKSVVTRAVKQNTADPKNLQKHLVDSAAISDELKKNNMFAPPPEKQHPVREVSGIFGDQVLIQNKWYSVGETVKDAKIVAIGATSVTVMWEGKESTFHPIESKIVEDKSGARGRTATARAGEGAEQNKKVEAASPKVTVKVEGGNQGIGPRGGPGGGFMAMRERFENMSERERQEFRDRMRERFARERGGDFGGRGGPGRRGPGGR